MQISFTRSLLLLIVLVILSLFAFQCAGSKEQSRVDNVPSQTEGTPPSASTPPPKPPDCLKVAENLRTFAQQKALDKTDFRHIRVIVTLSGEGKPEWKQYDAEPEIDTPTKARVMLPVNQLCRFGDDPTVLLVQPRPVEQGDPPDPGIRYGDLEQKEP